MSHRLVIAGTHSGVGKTTITVGLIAALRQRGLTVQPFKVGPDYIDPTYHTLAAGRPCRNLDTWMVPPQRVRSMFVRAAGKVAVSLIEGVMGVYDGLGYAEETGSTAEVAKLLQAPVVLVLDASRMARSAAALALGYRRFDEALPLAGFLLNRIGSARHAAGVAAAVERATGLPVFGCLPRDEKLTVPERHLGLVPATPSGPPDFVDAAADFISRHVDVDRLLHLARAAPVLPVDDWPRESNGGLPEGRRPVIAVAHDEAFHFTYDESLELLRAAGADIAFFSPLRNRELPPETTGLILGGGFPEVYAALLSANEPMLGAIRAAHERSLPVYAECGGLMYLTRAVVDQEGREYPMVGLLPGKSVMSGRPTLGYRLARPVQTSWLLRSDETLRGHEFHYSRWEGRPEDLCPAYLVESPNGGERRPEGACLGNLLASYVHLHFGGLPELAARFVAACRRETLPSKSAGEARSG